MTTQVAERYRLVTRSDFDGLVCAALLKELGILDDILFVHPKDMQDGKVELTDRDITTNLPYAPGVHLSFDHHDSETIRVTDAPENHIIVAGAKSAARVVYDHFGGADVFQLVGEDIMAAVDKADAADFTREEILEPQGWDYISFLMDPRTGLGRFREFRISNYQLMMQLIDDITTKSIEEILQTPGRRRARRALPRARRPGDRPGRPLRHPARQPRRARLPQRGQDLRDQPLHGLRALPRLQHLDPRPLGPAAAEHRLRHRQVDPEPHQRHRHRRAHALLRRRRPQRGRHLPGRQRGRRARPRRADRARSTRTA